MEDDTLKATVLNNSFTEQTLLYESEAPNKSQCNYQHNIDNKTLEFPRGYSN
ncbi:hypothetical protein DPMN_184795 [Dreissena polymorpha]|uniref:Uncharacterized protein n=1 Tax=Dreissena polymorpha TaxID=45954 RepID=A0A9D4I859_DREPO|nr:hypothetical protein DPMN_184756 [Dreissena polymorpha]KAH3750249.1 hypothetical protein DPMN_184769 [Dreissena polymorpha]KAH3750275.1 hypothetical protein DPMN_184795 [Dreissena polymorpha]